MATAFEREMSDAEIRETVRQMLWDWNSLPEATRAELLAIAAKRAAAAEKKAGCPACNGVAVLTDDPRVLRCERCGAIFSRREEPLTIEQVDRHVRVTAPMIANAIDGRFYFDFFYVDEHDQTARMHGWACAKTRRVEQWG